MSPTSIDQPLIRELHKRGMRVTPQRLVIHRILRRQARHTTAEQLLESVSDVLPGTSLPTVYATLDLLEELGVVRRIGTGNGAVLFDSRAEPHAHTMCRRCGAVSDLDGAAPPPGALERAGQDGFIADHAQLVIWGQCADCAAAERAA